MTLRTARDEEGRVRRAHARRAKLTEDSGCVLARESVWSGRIDVRSFRTVLGGVQTER